MEDDTRPQHGETTRGRDADALAEQLNQTTTPDAGGNVSGTKPEDAPGGLDIVFEAEEDAHAGH
ncbi:hypothetical protein [Sphingomonas xinjiangensis]|uniref:Uncharacterized protein n=1 Tax=Sphingomonas xinjiangensis TaxID=643568 RepID=A0A840YLK7_9SPHN|nr:hypothetical protein [Sphingomonas xinjiangensis]MBB5710200.1 hypothetical protein [Sphingomonas xinjiangensis]